MTLVSFPTLVVCRLVACLISFDSLKTTVGAKTQQAVRRGVFSASSSAPPRFATVPSTVAGATHGA